jgi:large subunit ribosomal protein L10
LAITKERKHRLVDEYTKLIADNAALIFTTYSGLSVKELQELRRQLRETGSEFHIVKNNLVKLAFKEDELPFPEDVLVGPTAVGFASEYIIGLAKAIVELSRESESMAIKVAIIDGVLYDAKQVGRLADLPPLPVVRAQFLSVLQAPATLVAGILGGSVRQLVNLFKAYAESESAAA